MDRLDFKDYKEKVQKHVLSGFHSQYFNYVLSKIEEIIEVDEIQEFYPRFIFSREADTELYIFTKDKLYVVTGSSNYMSMKSYKLEDITDVNFELKRDYQEIASLRFVINDMNFYFHSEEDSNETWNNTFLEKIKNIVRLI